MRSGGTKTKTGDQIDEELENIAASVESQIGESSGSVSFSCLKENTDHVLEIFKEFLTSPEFREDKVELSKTQLRSETSCFVSTTATPSKSRSSIITRGHNND